MQTKEQHNKYNNEWAKNNRGKINVYFTNWRKKRREWFDLLKSKLECKNCGEKDINCLDFHHTNASNKVSEVGKMFAKHVNRQIILREIKKCKVLCSNCHRKEHTT